MTLDQILENHAKWLECSNLGERADLREADLQGADLRKSNLRGADLREADLQGADLREADLQGAVLRGADLQGAVLRGADLRWADLQGADLRGADLDFSCFPLWCGGSHFKCSLKLVQQLFAHISTLEVVDADAEMKATLEAILGEAKKSHRAGDLNV